MQPTGFGHGNWLDIHLSHAPFCSDLGYLYGHVTSRNQTVPYYAFIRSKAKRLLVPGALCSNGSSARRACCYWRLFISNIPLRLVSNDFPSHHFAVDGLAQYLDGNRLLCDLGSCATGCGNTNTRPICSPRSMVQIRELIEMRKHVLRRRTELQCL